MKYGIFSLALATLAIPALASAQSMPAWKSYQTTKNPADMVLSAGNSNSVAAWMQRKADVTNGTLNTPTITNGVLNSPQLSGGTLTNPTISGGVENITPTDIPGQSGTSIANTYWVDKYYLPRSNVITQNTQWTVCSSGCTYSDVASAWNSAVIQQFTNGAILTITISHGTYNISSQLLTETPNTKNVHIIGDTSSKSSVVLNFTGTKGNNGNGFIANQGGMIGLIDGMTITTPTDGTGALSSTDSSGRNLWNSQSYGSGIQAYGGGSSIKLGPNLTISNFYYGIVADDGGFVDGRDGSVVITKSGDANIMARGDGVVVCLSCTVSDASDYTSPSVTVLGSNFDAERGGSLYINGSTGAKTLVNGLLGLTGGHIWAHNTSFTGGLNSGGDGAWIFENASAELTSASFSGYKNGLHTQGGGFATVDNATFTSNSNDGILVDGGRVEGANATITKNSVYGIQAIHQGSAVLFSTYSNMSGNGTNIVAQASGTESSSGSAYTASSLDIQ